MRRNKKELTHPGNKGLEIAVELLKPIKTKYASVTWAGKHNALTLINVHQTSRYCVQPLVPGKTSTAPSERSSSTLRGPALASR